MTALGSHLLETGQLRDGIDLGEVRDVLWNYLAVDHYERLVLSRAGRSSGTRAGSPTPSPVPCARYREMWPETRNSSSC
jgi:hypothetical protein